MKEIILFVAMVISILFVAIVITILTVAGLVWIPAIIGCNEVGGELVINAFNWPVCVPSAR